MLPSSVPSLWLTGGYGQTASYCWITKGACLELTNFPAAACRHTSCSEKEIIHGSLSISGRGLRTGWTTLCIPVAVCLLKKHGQAVNANLSLLHSTLPRCVLCEAPFSPFLLSDCNTVHFWHSTTHESLPSPLPYKGRKGRLLQLRLACRNYVCPHHGTIGAG